jgi:predicted HicB family RNase H-like nuclease
LGGLEAVVSDVLADMTDQGEKVPVPFSERSYSGTFNVRIGEGLHRDLVLHAAEDGLSLNQYVVKKLASA